MGSCSQNLLQIFMLNIFVTGLYPHVLAPALALNSSYSIALTLFTLCVFIVPPGLHLTGLRSDFLLLLQYSFQYTLPEQSMVFLTVSCSDTRTMVLIPSKLC